MTKRKRLQPARHSIHKPYRIEREKPIWRKRFFWLGILIFFLAGSGFYFFLLSETFQVKKIIVSGEKKVTKEEIESIVEPRLGNTILSLQTKSIFLVNFKEIKKEVLNAFPQIAEVELRRGFPDTLDILIIERAGLAVWCQGDNCFLLDGEGIIFEKVPLPEDKELIRIKRKNGADYPGFGESAIEKEKLEQILRIEKELREKLKIPSEEILISSESRADFKTSEGLEIYFDLEKDLEGQLGKLQAILKEKNFSQERENLQYIDLRFERIYYK